LIHHESGTPITLGILKVVNDLDRVFRGLKERAVMILAGNTIMIFMIAGFIVVIFHFLVTRHLIELDRHLSNIRIGSENESNDRQGVSAGKKKMDERERVIAATGAMQERIHKSFDELRKSEKRYRELISQMSAGFALHEMLYDEDGRPQDYRFLEVNAAFERLTGLKAKAMIGKTALEVLPNTYSRTGCRVWYPR
jgi:PAS domain-containing protein